MLLTISSFLDWVICNKVILIPIHLVCCLGLGFHFFGADSSSEHWYPRKLKSKQDLLLSILKSSGGIPMFLILLVLAILGALLEGLKAFKNYLMSSLTHINKPLGIGSEIRLYKHGHVGKITREIPGFWGVYWYGGLEGKDRGDRIREKGIPPSWFPKSIEQI